jgi:hypothetical protein
MSATASSAVAFVRTFGVFVARRPRSRTASMSMLSKPTAKFETTFSVAPARSSRSPRTGTVGSATIASAPGACS